VSGASVETNPKEAGYTVPLSGSDKRQRIYLVLMIAAAMALTIAVSIYGLEYYILGPAQRPFSAKHPDLKPSGTIGLRLGMLGFFLFILVYLYPLRKQWSFLARIGKTKNWFDFHVLMGLVAPVVITFHSAFKIHGFAGMAYWTMIGLVVSGIIGRYFYAQIPRNISSAEMSLKEMQELKTSFLEVLSRQKVLDLLGIELLFRLPDAGEVQRMPLFRALLQMVALDIARPLRVWALRRKGRSFLQNVGTLGGIIGTTNRELERAVSLASRQAALSKRILYLSKTQRVFHLWHIVHRPFSISFAIFVIIHITVVFWLGYF
jgi:hypothetical protein